MSFVLTGPTKQARVTPQGEKINNDGDQKRTPFAPDLDAPYRKTPFRRKRDVLQGDYSWAFVDECDLRTTYITPALLEAKAAKLGITLTKGKIVKAPDGVLPHCVVGGHCVVAGNDQLTGLLAHLAPFFMNAYECANFVHYPALLVFFEYIMGAATNRDVDEAVALCRVEARLPIRRGSDLHPVHLLLPEEFDAFVLWLKLEEILREITDGKAQLGRLPDRLLHTTPVKEEYLGQYNPASGTVVYCKAKMGAHEFCHAALCMVFQSLKTRPHEGAVRALMALLFREPGATKEALLRAIEECSAGPSNGPMVHFFDLFGRGDVDLVFDDEKGLQILWPESPDTFRSHPISYDVGTRVAQMLSDGKALTSDAIHSQREILDKQRAREEGKEGLRPAKKVNLGSEFAKRINALIAEVEASKKQTSRQPAAPAPFMPSFAMTPSTTSMPFTTIPSETGKSMEGKRDKPWPRRLKMIDGKTVVTFSGDNSSDEDDADVTEEKNAERRAAPPPEVAPLGVSSAPADRPLGVGDATAPRKIIPSDYVEPRHTDANGQPMRGSWKNGVFRPDEDKIADFLGLYFTDGTRSLRDLLFHIGADTSQIGALVNHIFGDLGHPLNPYHLYIKRGVEPVQYAPDARISEMSSPLKALKDARFTYKTSKYREQKKGKTPIMALLEKAMRRDYPNGVPAPKRMTYVAWSDEDREKFRAWSRELNEEKKRRRDQRKTKKSDKGLEGAKKSDKLGKDTTPKTPKATVVADPGALEGDPGKIGPELWQSLTKPQQEAYKRGRALSKKKEKKEVAPTPMAPTPGPRGGSTVRFEQDRTGGEAAKTDQKMAPPPARGGRSKAAAESTVAELLSEVPPIADFFPQATYWWRHQGGDRYFPKIQAGSEPNWIVLQQAVFSAPTATRATFYAVVTDHLRSVRAFGVGVSDRPD